MGGAQVLGLVDHDVPVAVAQEGPGPGLHVDVSEPAAVILLLLPFDVGRDHLDARAVGAAEEVHGGLLGRQRAPLDGETDAVEDVVAVCLDDQLRTLGGRGSGEFGHLGLPVRVQMRLRVLQEDQPARLGGEAGDDDGQGVRQAKPTLVGRRRRVAVRASPKP